MEKKKIWLIIGLIVLVWMSMAGQYLSITELYDDAWWLGLIDMGIITAVMVIIPLLCRLINKERIEIIKGKKICKKNSFGVILFFAIIDILRFGGIYDEVFENIGRNAVYAIIFYFINKWLFVYDENSIQSTKTKKIKKEANDELTNIAETLEESSKSKIKKSKYCKMCGGKLDSNKKCQKCGKQYFKLNKNIIFYVIIGLLVISNIVFILLYSNSKKSLQNITDTLVDSSDWCETQLNLIKGEHDIFYIQEKLDFFDENIVFVIEGYGDYYYTYDCVQKITDGEEYSYWAYNKEAAMAKGYQRGSCY